MGLVHLMEWQLVPMLVGDVLAGSGLPLLPASAAEVALQRVRRESRIVLELSNRRISLVRGEQRLGLWPVAIGDPNTPTPRGAPPSPKS